MDTLQQKFRNFKIEKEQLKNINGGLDTFKCWISTTSLRPTTFHHEKDVRRWESIFPQGRCYKIQE